MNAPFFQFLHDQDADDPLKTVIGVSIFALALSHLAAFWLGGEFWNWATRMEIERKAQEPRRVVVPEPAALQNENCLEVARACYSRKRMEKVRKEG